MTARRNKRASDPTSSSVAVIGAGYVGLPTAATLAHFGHHVVLAEHDQHRLAALRSGRMPIVEPGLDELVAEGVGSGALHFAASSVQAVAGSEFVFLCVPTPQGDDGSADLSYVEAAAKEIGPLLEPGTIVVNKSTVPVGSATFVERIIGRPDIRVVSNPEFLREGSAVRDSLRPERLVVGADDPEAASRVGGLFASTGAPLIITDATTAETIKYASNAFLATKLSYVNAVAGLCEELGADVRDVMLGLGYDKRIGFDFLRPGPGWGGSCLPKDTRALLHIAQEVGYDFSLLAGAIASNEQQLARVVAKVETACGGSVEATAVGVWGLTFKANTDDRRDSPSLQIAHRLVARGARVQAFDPTVVADDATGAPADAHTVAATHAHADADSDHGPEDLRGLSLCGDPYEAATGASVVVVLTEWDEFRWVDFARLHTLMATPSIVDARNLLDPAALRRIGFLYTGIGRR
jgi:UDPglucose 6-dehydrogenase